MAAEANYDVRNRELLSIKAVLVEWRAKCLNPHQARWALFFTRFEFSVTYRPGTKNSKADALSRQFEAQSEPSQPDLILPAAAILAPVRWSLIEEIQRAHADEPPSVNCPSTKVYVSSASTCYNGFTRLPAPVTRGSLGRLNSLYAVSGGHLLGQMWRGLSGHALLAPSLGSVTSSRRDCWNPYLLPNTPGPTCLWTFSPTYPTQEDSPR
ncbi:hypothetical protein QTP70_021392 [Hemibagrus guttatus]|uniref:Reverse transcriptase RNase H-like domain-containing protein n=1 Tax=Hemibagrus guttatus TaxID=175788 RepID=A0AAE0QIT5_9TELE|nr:hypothetical protein QTP70_021392 [Hemibagrus guttatus]